MTQRNRIGPRRGWLTLLLALTLVLPGVTIATPPIASQSVAEADADVRPELRAEVAADVADGVSTYVIDATLDEATSTITGTMDVAFHNEAATPLAEVYFRLYPNIAYYAEGDLAIADVTVNGAAATTGLEVDATALRVDLTEPLPANGAIDLALSFTTTVPIDAGGSYGIFRRDSANGTWILADWHPVLAVFEDGHGWHLNPATSAGDPTHAASSFYDVTFTAPESLTVVASGLPVTEETAAGSRTARFITGPAREFTLVVDDDFVQTSDEIDGLTISVYTEPKTPAAAAEETLAIAARSVRVFGELFGPYPFTELDLVETGLAGALAVSWSGVIFLDSAAMLGRMATADPLGYETIVAHEIAHQWWGGMIGSNSNDHTFINEGLATLSSIIFLERTAGAEAAAAARDAWLLTPARRLLTRGDRVVDQPIAEGQDELARADSIYGKGALGFAAIRRQIGDEAFFAALRDHADAFRFAIAEPDDLREAFAAASGQDLDALWSHWFNETALTAAEIDTFE
ncbi:MAG: M1 family metallopeptidase [Chloroflexia bacterium]|nr:M1 family metallopeptidase [Chloroflexia bacterium]